MPDRKVNRSTPRSNPSLARERYLETQLREIAKTIKAMLDETGAPRGSTSTAWSQACKRRDSLHAELMTLRHARLAAEDTPSTSEEDLLELLGAIAEMPEAYVERIAEACRARLSSTALPTGPRLAVVNDEDSE